MTILREINTIPAKVWEAETGLAGGMNPPKSLYPGLDQERLRWHR